MGFAITVLSRAKMQIAYDPIDKLAVFEFILGLDKNTPASMMPSTLFSKRSETAQLGREAVLAFRTILTASFWQSL